MSGLTVKSPGNLSPSPKGTNVGEIDTSAPFQSVKAAVSLFGEVSPGSSSTSAAPVTKKSKAEERVLEKETLHSMMLRELDCYKEQLKNAEAARTQAQRDLERANRTLQQLTNKLETLNESKQASFKATEAAKIRLKELEEQRSQRGSDAWKAVIESEREAYKACTGELAAVKQEVVTLRQDYDAALQDKLAIFQKLEDAQSAAQMNQEKQSRLLGEVTSLRETLDQVRLASLRAEEEHSRLIADKESCLPMRKSAKKEAEKEIAQLREESKPKEVLEQKLAETMDAVRVLQEQLNDIHASDWNLVKTMASELDDAKRKLQEVVAEENSIQSSVEAIKQQLEEVKKERAESEQKALKAEATLEELQAELVQKKIELEAAMSKCASAARETLSVDTEKARQETEDYKKSAELLNQEAKAARIQTKEAEENLKIALKKAEEAKAAQKLAEEQLQNQPIILSLEEVESMRKKIEDFESQADVKVATAMAQMESINMSKKEASQKLEEVLKESGALQSEIDNALKRAEMAEAAKRVVETELQKRLNEQNEAGGSSNTPQAE